MHESESTGNHESAPRRTNPFVVIPHGSNSHIVCPNGVASEVQANASETAVSCYTDPSPKDDNHIIAIIFLGFVACIVAAVLSS
ncbi:hypothetical protein [Burkholderia phage FLC9]|nr:hypothetical protein [Burkholderia phage FLC9]